MIGESGTLSLFTDGVYSDHHIVDNKSKSKNKSVGGEPNTIITTLDSNPTTVKIELKLYIDSHSVGAPNVSMCESCSSCCQFCGEPPFASYKELDGLPKPLRDELYEYISNMEKNHVPSRGSQNLPCMWLNVESGLCVNYEYRPKICRDFAISGSDCLFFRDKVDRGR